MKIVTSATMRAVDDLAVKKHRLSVKKLMEAAGRAVADDIIANRKLQIANLKSKGVVICCGKGNNGGDGLVAARYLKRAGVPVTVFKEFTPSVVKRLTHALSGTGLVVDALLGTGARLPITGVMADVVRAINRAGVPVLAVDIPSGLNPDTGEAGEACVNADRTITLGAPKIGFFLGEALRWTGRIVVKDIGLPENIFETMPSEGEWMDERTVQPLLPKRKKIIHKGEAGRVLIIGGSTEYTGAALLAARGAFRAGCGMVYAAVPSVVRPVFQQGLPEAILVDIEDAGQLKEAADRCQAVVIGPGLGRAPKTIRMVGKIIMKWPHPMVVDADALHALAQTPAVWSRLPAPERLVLTPHEGEMAVLCGKKVESVKESRWETAVAFAMTHRVHVVLKGPHTLTAAPDGCMAVNGSGHSGMATAGMGDVLSGIIGSLIAQGVSVWDAPFGGTHHRDQQKSVWDAARAGVFIHGKAAELAAEKLGGPIGIVANDVAEALPAALHHVKSASKNLLDPTGLPDRGAEPVVVRQAHHAR